LSDDRRSSLSTGRDFSFDTGLKLRSPPSPFADWRHELFHQRWN